MKREETIRWLSINYIHCYSFPSPIKRQLSKLCPMLTSWLYSLLSFGFSIQHNELDSDLRPGCLIFNFIRYYLY